MLILLLSLFYHMTLSHACDFAPQVKSVYSLSGVVTLMMRDLKLIQNDRLKGVSIFHPIERKVFKGVFLPGGVFLSHEMIKSFSGSVVFYDESRELSKIFHKYQNITSVEIKTRQQNPQEVLSSAISKLRPYLKGCSEKNLISELEKKLDELKKLAIKKETFLFFLGAITGKRLPEMLMVKDGVVKWLSEEKLIQTYPSELAYVNWSSRILNQLPKNTYRIGLSDSGSEMKQKIEKVDHGINLTYPGALIPGVGQVDAMIYLFKHL